MTFLGGGKGDYCSFDNSQTSRRNALTQLQLRRYPSFGFVATPHFVPNSPNEILPLGGGGSRSETEGGLATDSRGSGCALVRAFLVCPPPPSPPSRGRFPSPGGGGSVCGWPSRAVRQRHWNAFPTPCLFAIVAPCHAFTGAVAAL